MSRMSSRSLDRCYRIYICEQTKQAGEYRVSIYVKSPGNPGHRAATHFARTQTDTERVLRAWMGRYRVPEENVFRSELEVCDLCNNWFEMKLPKEDGIELCADCRRKSAEEKDASSSNGWAPKVHESR